VLTWVARGKTSADIAQIIGLTKRTVDFHIDNAREKSARRPAPRRWSRRRAAS
jgi:DNA-binding NarL/FixJ family response regulator